MDRVHEKKHSSTGHFQTKDLAEASFILTHAVPLVQIERKNGTCWFIFEQSDRCHGLIRDFWFNDAHVPGKKFYDSIQTLKHQIFSNQ